MKTPPTRPRPFTPSLLDQLREKSEALRAQGPGRAQADGGGDQGYRSHPVAHLPLARRGHRPPRGDPAARRPRLPSRQRADRSSGRRFDRGFVSFRRRALAGLEVLEHVEMFYRLEGDKPIALRLNPAASLGVEERLRTSTLPYQYQTEQDERRVVRYGLFQVQPHISASVRFEADYHHQVIAGHAAQRRPLRVGVARVRPRQADRGRARGPASSS